MAPIKATVFRGGNKDGKVRQASETYDPKPDELVMRIVASGLCYTDHEYLGQDQVLGHEPVGIVEEVGSQCSRFKVGDRVGFGYNHGACLHCNECLSGNEYYCLERKMFGIDDLDRGSFASHCVIKEAFCFSIPENLTDEEAAPLNCAGVTVFGGLVKSGVKPWSRVGVVGQGGLGHLAIQFAHKMGCEVHVFSRTDNKKDEALKLGADYFHATKETSLKDLAKSIKLDILLVTISGQADWAGYFNLMAPLGKVCPLGISFDNMEHPYMTMLTQGIEVIGSVGGTRYVHEKMLEFAARNDVKPMVELLPMTEAGINEGFERLAKGDVRYRFVLKPSK